MDSIQTVICILPKVTANLSTIVKPQRMQTLPPCQRQSLSRHPEIVNARSDGYRQVILTALANRQSRHLPERNAALGNGCRIDGRQVNERRRIGRNFDTLPVLLR